MSQIWNFSVPRAEARMIWEDLKAGTLQECEAEAPVEKGGDIKNTEDSSKALIPEIEIKVTPPGALPSDFGDYSQVRVRSNRSLPVPEFNHKVPSPYHNGVRRKREKEKKGSRSKTSKNTSAQTPIHMSKGGLSIKEGEYIVQADESNTLWTEKVKATLRAVPIRKPITSSKTSEDKDSQSEKLNISSATDQKDAAKEALATKPGPSIEGFRSSDIEDFLSLSDGRGQIRKGLETILRAYKPKTGSKKEEETAKTKKSQSSFATDIRALLRESSVSKPDLGGEEIGHNDELKQIREGLESVWRQYKPSLTASNNCGEENTQAKRTQGSWAAEIRAALKEVLVVETGPSSRVAGEMVLADESKLSASRKAKKPNWYSEGRNTLSKSPGTPNPTISWDFWSEEQDDTPEVKVSRTGYELSLQAPGPNLEAPGLFCVPARGACEYQFGNREEDPCYELFAEGTELGPDISAIRCVFNQRYGCWGDASSDDKSDGEDEEDAKAD